MTQSAESAAIEARNVSRIFGSGDAQVTALDNVSVTIRENEFFTLLGPSGCGKTTLLRLIAGFDFPNSGEILLYGSDIAPLPPYKRPVNTVFQSYALFPHMTVAQNIGFGLEMLGRPKAEIDARVAEMLRLVQMEALKDRRTSQISGGQQQRVALARALAPQPKVLLLDEPLSALDYKLRKEMQIEPLKRLQGETGITFIFVTHDQEEALSMSDRIAVMSAGRILQVGEPWEIYDRPAERFVADFIGESNFLPAEVISVESDHARVRLGSGQPSGQPSRDMSPTGKVTVVIRPEHARTVGVDDKADLSGTVENVVYLGTDTQLHARLDDGAHFVIRHQNSGSRRSGPKTGQRIGIALGPDVAQILKD